MLPYWGCEVKGGLKMKNIFSSDDVRLSEKPEGLKKKGSDLHSHSGEVGCNKLNMLI